MKQTSTISHMLEDADISIRHSLMACRTLNRDVRSYTITHAADWMRDHRFSAEEIDDEIDDKMRPLALCLEHLEQAARYMEMAEYNLARIE